MYNKIAPLKFKRLRHAAATPFILGMSVPIVCLDIFLEIYHRTTFPLYGLPVNQRGKYIKIDRHKLSYLSTLDKCWCTYCGYANGVFNYAVKIAGDTERYWCAVKHQDDPEFVMPKHHRDFLPYNDEEAFARFIEQKGEQPTTPLNKATKTAGVSRSLTSKVSH